MNHSEHSIEQRELDRFVDGEMNVVEERELLRRLESSPKSWRNLALTFVEARAFQSHMTEDTRHSESSVIVTATVPVRDSRSIELSRLQLFGALIACIAISFCGVQLFQSFESRLHSEQVESAEPGEFIQVVIREENSEHVARIPLHEVSDAAEANSNSVAAWKTQLPFKLPDGKWGGLPVQVYMTLSQQTYYQ